MADIFNHLVRRQQQAALDNARAQTALTPPRGVSFHVVIIKNPVTGKDEQMLFDDQGDRLRTVGQAVVAASMPSVDAARITALMTADLTQAH